MKIAITATGSKMDSKVDGRFGRCSHFFIINTETNEQSFVENMAMNATGGAGTTSAQMLIDQKVEKVISGEFGPKARDVLSRFNVQMVMLNSTDITIEELLKTLN